MSLIFPPAIVFVNNDLTDNVLAYIVKQLHIDEAIDGYNYDLRVANNPNYPDGYVRNVGLRLLVYRDLSEFNNRTTADVVMFVKGGMASTLYNNFGPPRQTYGVSNITWHKLAPKF